MRVLLLSIFVIVSIKSTAQIDSLYRNDRWWYCYQAKGLPVRQFFPVYSFKEQIDTFPAIRSLSYSRSQVSDSVITWKRIFKPADYSCSVKKTSVDEISISCNAPCKFEITRQGQRKIWAKGKIRKGMPAKVNTFNFPRPCRFNLYFIDNHNSVIKTFTLETTIEYNL